MALFGFALNYTNGGTDYVIVSAEDIASAESDLAVSVGCDNLESVTHYDAETILCEQYSGWAALTSELGG